MTYLGGTLRVMDPDDLLNQIFDCDAVGRGSLFGTASTEPARPITLEDMKALWDRPRQPPQDVFVVDVLSDGRPVYGYKPIPLLKDPPPHSVAASLLLLPDDGWRPE